jgi:hypothetical protein
VESLSSLVLFQNHNRTPWHRNLAFLFILWVEIPQLFGGSIFIEAISHSQADLVHHCGQVGEYQSTGGGALMVDNRRTVLLPIHMVETFSPQDATYVQSGTKVDKITRLWGIDPRGRPAEIKEGGYGVETVSGRRIKSWRVDRYLLEDIQWFINNLPSIVEASNAWAPQVIVFAMLLSRDLFTAIIEAGACAPMPITLSPQTLTLWRRILADAWAGDPSVIETLKMLGFKVQRERTDRRP